MNQPVSRFTLRPDGLVLGALFKDQPAGLLKPGVIYEIREVLGVLTIVEVGPAAIGHDRRDSMTGVHWCNEVGFILNVGRGEHLLTQDEWTQAAEAAQTRRPAA